MLKLWPVLVLIVFCLAIALDGAAQEAVVRNLVTDEPRVAKGKPDGAPDYVAKVNSTDGQHLALTIEKLENGIDPSRPFVIWAIGSSYTNMLGNGEAWMTEIPKRFPKAPPIEYRKMVGNACPWQYVRGWARHLVIPDQPDLVLIYTIGDPNDLEKLFVELRSHTTADIIVASIHWREPDLEMWGKSENSPQQDVESVRKVCRKYSVEFVENRRDWAEYLQAHQLPVAALLKDAVHQSDFGASIINANLIAHLQQPDGFSYDPSSRERIVQPSQHDGGALKATFVGNRIDLIGIKSPGGGSLRVMIDGKPADQIDAFLMSYVQPSARNSAVGRGAVPRDQAPHAITLGDDVEPQTWTITMTSDTGDYELVGSITGSDGKGNAKTPFQSESRQIVIEPELWRRAERNRRGDRFTFDVRRSTISEVHFDGVASEQFVVRLAQGLINGEHTLELVPMASGPTKIDGLKVYQPPM